MNAAPNSAPEITVVVDQLHPRLQYALETVLGEFMGLAPRLILKSDAAEIAAEQAAGMLVVSYALEPIQGIHCLPCNGLLHEDIIRQQAEQIDWFGKVSDQMRLPDHIACIFYHLSQYELLRPGNRIELDMHGRYPDSKVDLVVHRLLHELEQGLLPLLADRPSPRKFNYEITIDVDQPWKYLHKPLHVRWGGILRDRLRGADITERSQALRTGKDPFDVLETLQAICPTDKTSVFFLVGGDDLHDSRFDISMPAYRDYILQYLQAGFKVGIHPSYASMDDATILPKQKAALERVVGPVTIARQHFLRYSNPWTFRAMIAEGILRDYTLCRSQSPGAVTGVALPYRWFDLQRNVATQLVLVPAMVMDRCLQQSMDLDPQAALACILQEIEKVRTVRGHFVILLHNETFSDAGEWKGWRNILEKMLQTLRA